MKQKLIGFSICVTIFSAGLVAAFSSGPPDARTGAPGESNCTVACHSSFTLNAGPGNVSINAPATYDPNGTSVIFIQIVQSGQSRWGFEATMLDANDNFVGSFISGDPNRTQISTGGSREYIKQTSIGTDAGISNNSLGWEIHWVAPASDVGPVTLYVAGNAADNNGFNSGDHIYTTSIVINPAPSMSCCIGRRGDFNESQGTPEIDISDLVALVSFMFQGGPASGCPEEADINGSGGDPAIDISDLVMLVAFMFQGGPEPAPCP